jgi:hypothetical protein
MPLPKFLTLFYPSKSKKLKKRNLKKESVCLTDPISPKRLSNLPEKHFMNLQDHGKPPI